MTKVNTKISTTEIVSLVLLALSAVVLVALQEKEIGWGLIATGALSLVFTRRDFRNHIILLYISLALLGLVPITTETANENFARMGLVLGLAVSIPYIVSRFVYKDGLIQFRFHHGRRWFRTEVLYILFTALFAYIFLPFYLHDTGAYLNWGVENTTESIGRLFIGTNVLGIWDELFFVSTVLGILRKYMKFEWANILQAVLFTSFLYELGFTGWGPVAIFPFALLQGYVFAKTDSLLYVITIHLTLDFILFLALVNAHHPQVFNVFIT